MHSLTAQSELYVPVDDGKTDFSKGVDRFWAEVYTEFLVELKENKIDTLKTENEVYRFLWLRTFHNPIVIRIEKSHIGIKLFWRRSNGKGGYEAGEIVENKSIKLTQKQWGEFKELLKNSKFWKNPSIKRDQIIATDGAKWVLEGIKNNGYHISEILVHKPCLYLVKLTEMKIPEKKYTNTTYNNGHNSLWWNFIRKIPIFKLSLSYRGMVLADNSTTKPYTNR